MLACSCPYSLEYVAHSRLLCDPDNDREIIYQSNLLNTDSMTASELKAHVQDWVLSRPSIFISGELREINPYCNVSVTEIGDTRCLALMNRQTMPTVGTASEGAGEGAGTGHLAAIIAGSVGAGVGVLLLLFVIGCILCGCGRASGARKGKEVIGKKTVSKPEYK